MLIIPIICGTMLFTESKAMAVQICLDRAGYSCNTIDGRWGRKSERALWKYLTDRNHGIPPKALPGPERAYDRYFAGEENLFRIEAVTQADLDALVKIPDSPAEKAKLNSLGYESIREMFAERGHLSLTAIGQLNPGVDWEHPFAGLKLVIPDFPSATSHLTACRSPRRRPESMAATIRVSITNCEITACAADGRTLAFFPCSIARKRAKVPPQGTLKIATCLSNPNYTYTPDYTPPGQKVSRHVWPAGPNCPVGIAWIGLNLEGYGIHGTPNPEAVGFTGSHGCFRLANWNAARLFSLCNPGTEVRIEP